MSRPASNKPQCMKLVWQGYLGLAQCSNRGKIERDGKWYCGVHDPEREKARFDKRRTRWKLQDSVRAAERDVHYAEREVIAAATAWYDTGAVHYDGRLTAAVRALQTARINRDRAQSALEGHDL